MAEPTQKEMLQTLVHDVKDMKHQQDGMKIKQDGMDLTLHDIKIDLKGTNTDPDRGVIPRLIKVEGCVAVLKKRQYKIFTWGIVIVTAVSFIFTGFKVLVTFIRGG